MNRAKAPRDVVRKILLDQRIVAEQERDTMNLRCAYMSDYELGQDFEGQGVTWGEMREHLDQRVIDINNALEWVLEAVSA